jgi:hypothetical protein
MDWMKADESNETEVISDMLSVAHDFKALLNDTANDWDISESSAVRFFTEETPDILAGCAMDVTIVFDKELDRCAIPLDDV